MGILYVAQSKKFQAWAADVGLGKNVFKVGVVEDGTPEQALAAGLCGESDWKVLKAEEVEGLTEADALARLGRKEKLVDPNYYPRLKGEAGIVKANPVAVENALMVALALEGKEPKAVKIKPADIAAYLIRNAR